MSGISRLLRWAPCLWAISRLAQSSGQAQRTQILTSQSPQHPSGPKDLLHGLSFTTKTVVKPPQHQSPQPSRASIRPKSQDVHSPRPWRVSELFRYRGARQYAGFRWDHAPLWPIPELAECARRASNVLYLLTNSKRPPRSLEAEQGLLVGLTQLPRATEGEFSAIVRLVNRTCEHQTRQDFWRRKWLNVRPMLAYWPDVGERLKALAQYPEISRKVKLGAGPTDIEPIAQERALQLCPELKLLPNCKVVQVKVSSLDALNEVLLKQILRHHWQRIEHFAFAVEDYVLYIGKRSIFPDSRFFLPKLRKVTVDISNASEAPADGLFGDSAGPVSFLISQLVGRDNRAEGKDFELRLYCMPSPLVHARPRLGQDHIHLAARIFDLVRTVLQEGSRINIVAAFEGPFGLQVANNRKNIENWARDERIVLHDAPLTLRS